MSELINQNVFAEDKKFVDISGLSYFWSKTKKFVEDADVVISGKVTALENTVGDSTKGLVKDVKSIQDELNSLSGGAGSIATQIDNAIAALDLPNTYEAKGAAADALDAAKSYVDGKVDGKFDAAGTAAGLNTAMDARVVKLEAIDHNKIAADAAAAAVAGVIDDAPESFDTLKEVAAWIANNDHASDVATLMTDVANLKKIDHDAYVAADATTLAAAKDYVDGKVDGKFDAVGAAATAKAEAIADAEGKYQVKGSYEAAGAAAQALVDAKAYVDGKVDGKFDAAGAAADAQAAAIAQAKADATEALKAYYTKTEVDNLLSTNSSGDRAYAKQYTDELFGSFKFAQNSEIDALFA